MTVALSDHFSYGKLIRFTLPSMAMMVFTSVYGVVDGFFVSNFVGQTPFTAVNFIMPYLMILGTVGFMFGAGGSALVSKTLGNGDPEKANRIFSLLIYVSLGGGAVLAVGGILSLPAVASLLGAEGELLEQSVLYGRVVLLALPAFILQMEFQSFFVTAEKPQLGLAVTVAAGVANMVLDALLVGIFSFGLVGAAAATALSQAVGGFVPLIYFSRPNKSLLRLTKATFDGRSLWRTCTNGSSELMSNISMSLVGMLYNVQLLRYAGENGVAAYGVLMYVSMIFNGIFIGYSIGTTPVIGYHYGADNRTELKSILRKSSWIVGISSVGMFLLALVLAYPLSLLFVGYSPELLELTCSGFFIYSCAFLFMGFAIFGSGFFTALNDGLTSAIISFLRTLVFQTTAVIVLPLLLDVDGIWWSVVFAELMAMAVFLVFLAGKRKKYGY
ncbi:MAG: MATE family efflux transporter [Clostridia bacterium]|nr:MATE family efflux transporter [Clostridia bacterium]